MLEFLIDNIDVVLGTRSSNNQSELPWAQIVLPIEAKFILKLGQEKNKAVVVAFNSTFKYIDD